MGVLCTGNTELGGKGVGDGVTWIVVKVVSGTGHFFALGDYTMLMVTDTSEILGMFWWGKHQQKQH